MVTVNTSGTDGRESNRGGSSGGWNGGTGERSGGVDGTVGRAAVYDLWQKSSACTVPSGSFTRVVPPNSTLPKN